MYSYTSFGIAILKERSSPLPFTAFLKQSMDGQMYAPRPFLRPVAYICPSMDCFKKAVKGKGLERSFKMAIPKEVYETLEKEMEQLG